MFLVVSFCLAACRTTACDCEDDYSFKEQFEGSKKIFSGTVIEIVEAKEEFWPPWMKNTFTRITIQVDRYWKGSVKEKETIEWNSYCRYYLKRGDQLLFFVNSGFPYDWAGCGLSDRLDKSQEIVEKLGTGSTNFSRDWTIFYICVMLFIFVFPVRFLVKYRKRKKALEDTAYKMAGEIRDGKWRHLECLKSRPASECDEIILEFEKRCPGHTLGAYKKAISIGVMTIAD
jgi:hypothetical protein